MNSSCKTLALFLTVFFALSSAKAVVGGSPLQGQPAVVGLATDGRLNCTGILIARNFVLTAAHCVAGVQAHEIGIHLGDGAIQGHLSADQQKQLLQVKESGLHTHPLYIDNTLFKTYNKYYLYPQDTVDLAIIELKDSVESILEFPKLYPKTLKPKDVATLEIVGFGGHGDNFIQNRKFSKETGQKYHLLIDTTVTLGKEHFSLPIDKGHIYVGDSGGPVFIEQNGEHFLFGIHSGIDPFEKRQSYHTLVAKNLYWIQSIAHLPEDCEASNDLASDDATPSSIAQWERLLRTNRGSEIEVPHSTVALSTREAQFLLDHLTTTEHLLNSTTFFEALIQEALDSIDKSLTLSGLSAATKLPISVSGPWILRTMDRNFIYYGESDLTSVAADQFLNFGAEATPYISEVLGTMESGYQKSQLQDVLKRLNVQLGIY